MQQPHISLLTIRRIVSVSLILGLILLALIYVALSLGSTGQNWDEVWRTLLTRSRESTIWTIIWQIRFPRILLAASVGGTLGVGGLVFQALLRNPLAEPYILGISGGSAVGAISGMLLGLPLFPGGAFLAFAGSMGTLLLVVFISSGRNFIQESSLLLAGVMVNAFCSAIILFLISVTQSSKLHSILFWLMGDLSSVDPLQSLVLLIFLIPCYVLIFCMAKPMNILLTGKETAQSLGIHVRRVTYSLLVLTSLIVSATVCLAGLVGFVGLVIPHLLRLILGADHRMLVPACILGGASFMVGCDVLARSMPSQGEMPVGVVTALIGAPAFIYLLYRSRP